MESDRLLTLILVALLVAGVWIGLSVYQGDTYVHLLTGKEETVALTLGMQISLGEDLAFDFEQQLGGLVGDPQTQQRINRVGTRLVQALTQTENEKRARTGRKLNWAVFNFQFKVLNSNKINAFAIPNGSLYITKGLLQNLRSDDQVAAVFAHEIGHVVLRHAAKDLATRLRGNVVLLALQMILDKEIAQLVGGAAYLLELSYSREQELEADHAGYLLSCFAGYDPKAMIEVFEFFKAQEGNPVMEILLTHPLPQTRIDHLEELRCTLPSW
jgi:predicted Zn-dependent protease